MAHETAASFGAWCALKKSLPSQDDIQRLKTAGLNDCVNILRNLSLPDDPSSVFQIENLLLERYSLAARSISRFFSSSSSGLFIFLREELDWWNVLLLSKNTICYRNDRKTADLLFKPPTATISPPDPSLIHGLGDIKSSYYGLFPVDYRSVLSDEDIRPDNFNYVEYFVHAIRLSRFITLTAKLSTTMRLLFSEIIRMQFEALSAINNKGNIPEYYSDIMKRIKMSLPQPNSFHRNDEYSITDFESPYCRFIDLINARTRITAFCDNISRIYAHDQN
jgi:hypothetical protein